MKKLYIRTIEEELEIKDADNLEISFNEKFVKFGGHACVAIDKFVSYQFVENKDNE